MSILCFLTLHKHWKALQKSISEKINKNIANILFYETNMAAIDIRHTIYKSILKLRRHRVFV